MLRVDHFHSPLFGEGSIERPDLLIGGVRCELDTWVVQRFNSRVPQEEHPSTGRKLGKQLHKLPDFTGGGIHFC